MPGFKKVFTNTSNLGTLDVAGASGLAALALSGLLNADAGIEIDNGGNKFTVSTAGNVAASGTLDVTGASTLTGAVGVAGLLDANGGIDVDGGKFTVSTGGAVHAVSDFDVNTNKFTVNATNGNTLAAGTFTSTGAATLADDASVGGNLTITGISNLNSNTSVGGTFGVTGVTTLTGGLAANGGITCDTNKFVVADTTGNTTIAGTLDVDGKTSVGGAFSSAGVATLSSDATVGGTLGITGATTISSILAVDGAGTNTMAGNLTVTKDVNIGSGLTGGLTLAVGDFKVTEADSTSTLGGTLGVTGATTLSSTLGVSGTTTCSGTFNSTGTASFTGSTQTASGVVTLTNATGSTSSATGALKITGGVGMQENLYVGGLLGVTGNTTLTGSLAANGGISCDTNKFTVADTTGNTAIAGTLGVTGAASMGDTLAVTGITTLTGDLIASGGDITNATTGNPNNIFATSTGKTTLSIGHIDMGATTKNTTVKGLLVVDEASTLTGAVTASDTLAVSSDATVGGTLGVTGASTLSGAVTASDTLSVVGNATVGGTHGVTGVSTLSGALVVNNTLKLNSTAIADDGKFTVNNTSGNVATAGTLAVTGTSTFTGDVSAVNASASGTLGVTGVATFSDNVVISGNLNVTGAMTTNTSTEVVIGDRFINLGAGSVSGSQTAGFVMNVASSGTARNIANSALASAGSAGSYTYTISVTAGDFDADDATNGTYVQISSSYDGKELGDGVYSVKTYDGVGETIVLDQVADLSSDSDFCISPESWDDAVAALPSNATVAFVMSKVTVSVLKADTSGRLMYSYGGNGTDVAANWTYIVGHKSNPNAYVTHTLSNSATSATTLSASTAGLGQVNRIVAQAGGAGPSGTPIFLLPAPSASNYGDRIVLINKTAVPLEINDDGGDLDEAFTLAAGERAEFISGNTDNDATSVWYSM